MTFSNISKRRGGFTIVELLIVIVVVSILAAITVVAYVNIQGQARDSAVRSAADSFATALKQYSIRNDTPTGHGWGTTTAISDGVCTGGTSSGWAQPTTYACTIGDMLLAQGYLPANFFNDLPKNKKYNSSRYVFMLYPCSGGPANRYQLYYSLEHPTDEDTAQLVKNASKCNISSPMTTAQYTSYGMRSSLLVDLD